MFSVTFHNLTGREQRWVSVFLRHLCFLYDVGAFLSIFNHCYSAHEVILLSFTLVIVTVTETASDEVETSLEE